MRKKVGWYVSRVLASLHGISSEEGSRGNEQLLQSSLIEQGASLLDSLGDSCRGIIFLSLFFNWKFYRQNFHRSISNYQWGKSVECFPKRYSSSELRPVLDSTGRLRERGNEFVLRLNTYSLSTKVLRELLVKMRMLVADDLMVPEFHALMACACPPTLISLLLVRLGSKIRHAFAPSNSDVNLDSNLASFQIEVPGCNIFTQALDRTVKEDGQWMDCNAADPIRKVTQQPLLSNRKRILKFGEVLVKLEWREALLQNSPMLPIRTDDDICYLWLESVPQSTILDKSSIWLVSAEAVAKLGLVGDLIICLLAARSFLLFGGENNNPPVIAVEVTSWVSWHALCIRAYSLLPASQQMHIRCAVFGSGHELDYNDVFGFETLPSICEPNELGLASYEFLSALPCASLSSLRTCVTTSLNRLVADSTNNYSPSLILLGIAALRCPLSLVKRALASALSNQTQANLIASHFRILDNPCFPSEGSLLSYAMFWDDKRALLSSNHEISLFALSLHAAISTMTSTTVKHGLEAFLSEVIPGRSISRSTFGDCFDYSKKPDHSFSNASTHISLSFVARLFNMAARPLLTQIRMRLATAEADIVSSFEASLILTRQLLQTMPLLPNVDSHSIYSSFHVFNHAEMLYDLCYFMSLLGPKSAGLAHDLSSVMPHPCRTLTEECLRVHCEVLASYIKSCAPKVELIPTRVLDGLAKTCSQVKSEFGWQVALFIFPLIDALASTARGISCSFPSDFLPVVPLHPNMIPARVRGSMVFNGGNHEDLEDFLYCFFVYCACSWDAKTEDSDSSGRFALYACQTLKIPSQARANNQALAYEALTKAATCFLLHCSSPFLQRVLVYVAPCLLRHFYGSPDEVFEIDCKTTASALSIFVIDVMLMCSKRLHQACQIKHVSQLVRDVIGVLGFIENGEFTRFLGTRQTGRNSLGLVPLQVSALKHAEKVLHQDLGEEIAVCVVRPILMKIQDLEDRNRPVKLPLPASAKLAARLK